MYRSVTKADSSIYQRLSIERLTTTFIDIPRVCITGGSYYRASSAENGSLPISMADNRKIVSFSTNFGYKKNDGNGNINLEGRRTKMFTIIVTNVGNHLS